MRTFVALELPEQFKDETAGVARQLSAVIDARYTPRENYHITLAFLDETSEAQVRDAIGALEAAASAISPIPLLPDGIGKFGKSHNATLWLGIAKVPEIRGWKKACEVRLMKVESISTRRLFFPI